MPVATNCWVSPHGTDEFAGVTETLVNVRGRTVVVVVPPGFVVEVVVGVSVVDVDVLETTVVVGALGIVVVELESVVDVDVLVGREVVAASGTVDVDVEVDVAGIVVVVARVVEVLEGTIGVVVVVGVDAGLRAASMPAVSAPPETTTRLADSQVVLLSQYSARYCSVG